MTLRRPPCIFVSLVVCLGGFGCSTSSSDGASDQDAGSTTDDGGVTDGGASDDGGDDGGATDGGTEPIVATADMWTWVDFPQSKCANGTPTGIGVNPHAGAKDLLIYLEGGGACTTGASCWGDSPKAANVNGYDSAQFDAAPQKKYPILSRSLQANPFASLNMAYVPYCTGDMHAGTKEVDLQVNGTPKPTYFWGARDLDLFLARIAPTFPEVTRIWLAGTSAGGFGTVLTFHRVAQAFPGARIDVIDDSGPAILPKNGKENGSLAFWGFEAPSGCSPCTSFSEVLASARSLQPSSKYAFLSFTKDTVIAADFGYTLDEYPDVMNAFSDGLKDDPNAATFLVSNKASHVVESAPSLAPQYLPWFRQMVNDDPAWASTTYAVP